MKYSVGIDFGGTKITAGLVDEHGDIVKKIKLPTHMEKGKAFVLKQLFKAIGWTIEGFDKRDIFGIGIGVASPINFEKQIVATAPNLPLKNLALARIVQNRFKLKTRLENDANCAALAENLLNKADNFVLLTIGTGIGGAIVVDKNLYRGKDGYAGELGHIVIEANGPGCACGNRGCLEVLASGSAIKRRSRAVFGRSMLAADLARMRDARAKRILEEIGRYLGVGLTSIVNAFNPDEIILTGGVTEAGAAILKPAVKEMRKRVFTAAKNTHVRISELEDAGVLGAAYLFLK